MANYVRLAPVTYTCDECNEPILPQTQYARRSIFVGPHYVAKKFHLTCWEMYREWAKRSQQIG